MLMREFTRSPPRQLGNVPRLSPPEHSGYALEGASRSVSHAAALACPPVHMNRPRQLAIV